METLNKRERFKKEFNNLMLTIIHPVMSHMMDNFTAWGYKTMITEHSDSSPLGKCYKVFTKDTQKHIKITINADEEHFKTKIEAECFCGDGTIKIEDHYKPDEITPDLLQKIVIDSFSKIVQ